MSRRLIRLFALLAIAALAMGACGNDDEGESEDQVPTTEAANGDQSDDESGDPDDTTTTTEGAGDDPVESPDFAGADTACDVLAGFGEFAERIDAVFDDFEGAEADRAFAVAQAAYARAGELAPGELADDFALVSTGFGEFREILAMFDYDLDAIEAAEAEDPDRFADTIIESAEFSAAFASTAAYANEECGLDQ